MFLEQKRRFRPTFVCFRQRTVRLLRGGLHGLNVRSVCHADKISLSLGLSEGNSLLGMEWNNCSFGLDVISVITYQLWSLVF